MQAKHSMAFAASERRRIRGSGLRSDRFITNVTRPSRRRASINSLDGPQPLSAGIRVSSQHLVPQSSCELLPMLVAGESRVDGDVWPGWGRRRPRWPSSRRTSTSGKSPESEGDALVACYGRIMHPPPQSATCRDLRGARAELAALGPGVTEHVRRRPQAQTGLVGDGASPLGPGGRVSLRRLG